MHDLIVVGGGPSGTTCARVARQRGLRVLLITSGPTYERDLRLQVPVSRPALSLMGEQARETTRHLVSEVVVHPPGDGPVSCHRREPLLLADYTHLTEMLLTEAVDAGVELVRRQEVLAVEQLKRGIRVLARGESYQGHLLVGADGVSSVVASCVGARDSWAQSQLIGVRAQQVSAQPATFGGVNAQDESRTSILGLFPQVSNGCHGWTIQSAGRSVRGVFSTTCGKETLCNCWDSFVKRIRSERSVQNGQGGLRDFTLPCCTSGTRVVARRAMLVGSAGAFGSPLTGEDLFYAVSSGRIAAEVAADAADTRDPLYVRVYQDRVNSELVPQQVTTVRLYNELFGSTDSIRRLCDAARGSHTMSQQLGEVFAGTETGDKSLRTLRGMLHIARTTRDESA
ncbi:MAG: FAD-dependent oxidoreductase [Candidatus Thorarchaeota archaeon]|nr:FAD-dependent oxidoreductase [Candidatus Thorarchaeota archaeon]